jgi:hypothetical protein
LLIRSFAALKIQEIDNIYKKEVSKRCYKMR